MDLGCPFHVEDLGESNHTFHDIGAVERTRGILDPRHARGGIGVDASSIAVACDGDVAVGMAEFESQLLELEAGGGVGKDQGYRRYHDKSL